MIFNPLPDKQQNVTLTLTGSANDLSYIEIGGVQYRPAKSLSVSVGTAVYCHAEQNKTNEGEIIVNGEQIRNGLLYGSYTYTAVRDAMIDFSVGTSGGYPIIITITDT